MTDGAKVTIHMVMSLDGYVVKPDGSVAWLETTDRYEAGAPDPDVEAPTATASSSSSTTCAEATPERAPIGGWSDPDLLLRQSARAKRRRPPEGAESGASAGAG